MLAIFVMIISQAFNAIILPLTVAYIFYLGNRQDSIKKYKKTLVANGVLAAILFGIYVIDGGIGRLENDVCLVIFLYQLGGK